MGIDETRKRLSELSDGKYADFQAKLTPNVKRDLFIGVRVPDVRRLAKELYRSNGYEDFINTLPHVYYDENMLHGIIISEIKDYDECIAAVDAFLPYVDNWAVCDVMSPKCFKKNKHRLSEKIIGWTASDKTYTCRFGLEMLMRHYLDTDFNKEYLEIPAGVRSEEYYVRMMVAWFFATALTKQWDAAVTYLETNRLDRITHNMTVRKARESLRIPDDRKDYLKKLVR